MKKWLVLFLAVTLLLVMTGCSSTYGEDGRTITGFGLFMDALFTLVMIFIISGLMAWISPHLAAVMMVSGILFVILIFLRDIGAFAILPWILLGAFLIVTGIWAFKTIRDARDGVKKRFDILLYLKLAGVVCAMILTSVMSLGFARIPMKGLFYTIGESSFFPGFGIAFGCGLVVSTIKEIAEFLLNQKFFIRREQEKTREE